MTMTSRVTIYLNELIVLTVIIFVKSWGCRSAMFYLGKVENRHTHKKLKLKNIYFVLI